MVAVVLLLAGVVMMMARPFRIPLWLGPSLAAVVGVATGVIGRSVVGDSFDLLGNPLGFLVVAVPLAVLLDELGLFQALAATVDGGRHMVAALWVLAALVTALLNLDAAVVLLTPLYVHVARRQGLDVEALAFQPALLACLASSPLPVSNLTNLIVAEHFELGVGAFLAHLTVPTVAACLVGWICYRWAFHVHPQATPIDEPVDATALRRGLPIVAFVVTGFTLGDVVGIPPWVVAALASLWAALFARRWPWRTIPVEAIVVAAALTVLVLGASPHLPIDDILGHGGIGGRIAALGYGIVGSLAANNLPATIAALPALADDDAVWSLLVGVNMAPSLLLTGALSGLLWRDTARRLGVTVSMRRYTAVGVRVGLPALVAAGAVVVLVP